MNEYTTIWQGFFGLIGLSLASLLYAIGGRSQKLWRRLGGAAMLAAVVNTLLLWRGMWDPWALCVFPLLFIGFSMGYGADTMWMKVTRRTIYAFGVLSAGLLLAFLYGGNAWWILVPHVGVGLWSVWLGVKNPVEAAFEEMWICALLNMGLIAYPFVTGVVK